MREQHFHCMWSVDVVIIYTGESKHRTRPQTWGRHMTRSHAFLPWSQKMASVWSLWSSVGKLSITDPRSGPDVGFLRFGNRFDIWRKRKISIILLAAFWKKTFITFQISAILNALFLLHIVDLLAVKEYLGHQFNLLNYATGKQLPQTFLYGQAYLKRVPDCTPTIVCSLAVYSTLMHLVSESCLISGIDGALKRLSWIDEFQAALKPRRRKEEGTSNLEVICWESYGNWQAGGSSDLTQFQYNQRPLPPRIKVDPKKNSVELFSVQNGAFKMSQGQVRSEVFFYYYSNV